MLCIIKIAITKTGVAPGAGRAAESDSRAIPLVLFDE
jgi:hypothetical protein